MTKYTSNASCRLIDFKQHAATAVMPIGNMVVFTTTAANEQVSIPVPDGAVSCLFSLPSGTRRFTVDGVTTPNNSSGNVGFSSGNGFIWQVNRSSSFKIQFANSGSVLNLQWYGTA